MTARQSSPSNPPEDRPEEGGAQATPGGTLGPLGGGAEWNRFLERLERAAQSQATLLLVGEHGVGKGWLARWAHQESARAPLDPVELDLSTGNANLLESLLFGHAPGAFTGAQGERLGAARRAQDSTLILRRIDDLALELQVKLLRLLQERQVEPLGSEESIPVDLRVIGTAAPDLQGRVQAGTFREDLYYRFAVVVLEVPPLRARFQEVDDWLPAMASQAAIRVGRPARPLGPEAIQFLSQQRWPGNVRQLENALERALVLGGKQAAKHPIQAEEFAFLETGEGGSPVSDLARQGLAMGVDAEGWMAALLERALVESGGSVAQAARSVGLSRKAFEYRLQKHRELAAQRSQESTREGGAAEEGAQ